MNASITSEHITAIEGQRADGTDMLANVVVIAPMAGKRILRFVTSATVAANEAGDAAAAGIVLVSGMVSYVYEDGVNDGHALDMGLDLAISPMPKCASPYPKKSDWTSVTRRQRQRQ